MNDLTPKNMLRLYQQKSPDALTEQVEMLITQLGTNDALRFLAYQCIHLTKALQSLELEMKGGVSVVSIKDELQTKQ
jgi:hypothetical protein